MKLNSRELKAKSQIPKAKAETQKQNTAEAQRVPAHCKGGRDLNKTGALVKRRAKKRFGTGAEFI